MSRQNNIVFFVFFLLGRLLLVQGVTTYTICAMFQELTVPFDEQIVGLARMATEKVNAQNAATFQFEIIDVQLSSSSATAKIDALDDCFLGNTSTIAAIGPVTSSDSLLLSPYFGTFQIPIVSYGATSPIFSDKNIFPFFSRVIQDDTQQGEALVDLVLHFSWQNVAVIFQDDPYGRGLAGTFGSYAAAKGVEIVASESFEVDQPFSSAQMNNIIDSEANIFILIAFEEGAVSVLNEALNGGILGGDNVWVLSETGFAIPEKIIENPYNISQDQLDNIKGNLSGILGIRPREGQGPVYDAMLVDWTTRIGSGYPTIYDKTTTGLSSAAGNFLGSMAYDAVLTLGDAVKRMIDDGKDPVDGSELTKLIQATDIDGTTGQVAINSNGDRQGPYSVFNFQGDQDGNITTVDVAVWDVTTTPRLNFEAEIVWANGQTSTTYIPADNLLIEFSLDCPCIDPWDNSTRVNTSNALCPVSGFDSNGFETCVNVDYGAGSCFAYNENLLPECLTSDPASHCDKRWCFVDPQNCAREIQPSLLNFSNSGSELFISYVTCGNLDSYEEDRIIQELESISKLRVSYPDSSGSGYTLINEDNNVDGSFPRFMDSIFDKYGITKEIVPLSEASREYSPLSSFTACVHEIALNNTDVCVANTWSSTTRRSLASFLGSIYDDEIRLVTRRSSAGNVVLNSLADAFSNGLSPFLVFAPEVWIIIFVGLLYAGFVIYVVEIYVNKADREKEENSKKAIMFHAIQSFTGGLDIRYRPTKGPGMFVVMILSFFVLIIVTLFTAQITSNIIIQDSTVETEYKNINDALERNARICMLTTIANKFLLKYSDRKENVFLSKNARVALENMDSGACDVALLTQDEYENSRRYSQDYTPDCDKVQIDDILFTLGNTVPVREEYQQILAWAVEKDLDSYLEFERTSKAEFLAPSKCSDTDQKINEGTLTLDDLSGTFLIYFLTMTVILFSAFLVNRKRAIEENPNFRSMTSMRKLRIIKDIEDDEKDEEVQA